MSWYDYVPGVSNVAGVIKGDTAQAIGGPAGAGYNDLRNGAKAPYDEASSGVQGLAGQLQGFSGTQWDRQQQGLGGALGAMDQSNQWFNNSYGSSGPGAMENAWQNFGLSNQGPTRAGGASDAYGQYMQSQPMTYNGMTRANGMAGVGTDYSQYQNQLNGPGSANQFYNQNQGQYGQQGAGEKFYAQNQQNYNRQPGSMAVYDNFSNQLYQPGRSENFQSYTPTWGSTDEKVSSAMNYASAAQAPTRLEGQSGQLGNMYQGANNVNQFSRSAMPQLQGPGAYENFVTQDINGSNPALQMEREEGLANINQEMARRGQFNSGGADTAIGKFLGTMEAKDYENRSNRAQQAQQMQLGRLGQGTQMAQAASGETMNQAAGLQGLAGLQDAQRLERQQFGANTALSAADKNISQQGMNLQGSSLAMQAAQNADNSRNARLNTLQGMATAGDQSWNAQQQMGMQAANQAQNQQLARLQGGMQSGQMGDQSQMARLQAQFGMGQSADQQNLQRAQFQYQMGQGADANDMARYQLQGQLGNMADTQKQNQFTNYMQAAQQSQAAQQGRMQDAMAARFGIDRSNQGQYSPFYNQGGQYSGQAFADAMNAYGNAYGLKAQGGAAAAQVPFQIAGLGIQAGKAYGGGGA